MVDELAAVDPGKAGDQAREAQRAQMNAQEQTAQAAATAANEGGAAPAEAGVKMSASKGMMAAGAAAGAGLGLLYHKYLADNADRMEENMRNAEKPSSFVGAMRQSMSQAHSDSASRARDYPGASAAFNAARGALAGATSGAAAGDNLKYLLQGS